MINIIFYYFVYLCFIFFCLTDCQCDDISLFYIEHLCCFFRYHNSIISHLIFFMGFSVSHFYKICKFVFIIGHINISCDISIFTFKFHRCLFNRNILFYFLLTVQYFFKLTVLLLIYISIQTEHNIIYMNFTIMDTYHCIYRIFKTKAYG